MTTIITPTPSSTPEAPSNTTSGSIADTMNALQAFFGLIGQVIHVFSDILQESSNQFKNLNQEKQDDLSFLSFIMDLLNNFGDKLKDDPNKALWQKLLDDGWIKKVNGNYQLADKDGTVAMLQHVFEYLGGDTSWFNDPSQSGAGDKGGHGYWYSWFTGKPPGGDPEPAYGYFPPDNPDPNNPYDGKWVADPSRGGGLGTWWVWQDGTGHSPQNTDPKYTNWGADSALIKDCLGKSGTSLQNENTSRSAYWDTQIAGVQSTMSGLQAVTNNLSSIQSNIIQDMSALQNFYAVNS
jgi:hypothetical protein